MTPQQREEWRASVAVARLKIDELAGYGRQSPKHRAEVRAEISRRLRKQRAKFRAVIEEMDR